MRERTYDSHYRMDLPKMANLFPSQNGIVHLFRDRKGKILHRNRSQVQVSLKVTAQLEHLNITVTLEFFLNHDLFSIDQSLEIAGKLNNHVLDYK